MALGVPQNQAPFSLDEIVEATGGRLWGRGVQAVRGVATDTRESLDNKAFVALRGERFDGHDYLHRALARGAGVIVAEAGPRLEELRAAGANTSLVVVDDSLVALGALAHFHRRRWGKTVIAIGGSAGKTTTRSVTSLLLESIAPGRVLSTAGNFNNRIGVPMTMLCLDIEHELAVLELGTSQRGEMRALSRLAEPDVALLTLIDWEHSLGLGDLDGIEREEAGLFEGLVAGGVALGFGEDVRVERQLELCRAAKKLRYRLSGDGFAVLRQRRPIAEGRVRLELSVGGRGLVVETSLLGRPGSLAVLAGLAISEVLFPGRLEGQDASCALAAAGESGRSSLVVLDDGVLVLDDTYNSNPASVENSVATGQELAGQTGGRLYLALGEMLELGDFTERAHEEMGRVASASGAALLIGIQGAAELAVQEARARGLEAEFVPDASQAAALLFPLLAAGDVVVVKASRGVGAERLVDDLVARIGRKAPGSATSGGASGSPGVLATEGAP